MHYRGEFPNSAFPHFSFRVHLQLINATCTNKLTLSLFSLLQGLDNVSSATLRPFNSDINTPRIDSYRFSMANLEGKLVVPHSGLSTLSFHPEKSSDLSPISARPNRDARTERKVASKDARLSTRLTTFSPIFPAPLRQIKMTGGRRTLSIDHRRKLDDEDRERSFGFPSLSPFLPAFSISQRSGKRLSPVAHL